MPCDLEDPMLLVMPGMENAMRSGRPYAIGDARGGKCHVIWKTLCYW